MAAVSRWSRRIGLVVGVVALGIFLAWAVRHFENADWSRYRNPAGAAGLALAAGLCACIIPISALAWRRLLADVGQNANASKLIGILGMSNLGKYLPGNIGHHAGRVTLALACGLPLSAIAATMASETLLSLSAAAVVAALGFALAPIDVATLLGPIAFPAHMAAWIFASLISALLVAIYARHLLPLRSRQRMAALLPRPRTLLPVLVAYCGTFFCAGLGLVILAYALFPHSAHDPLFLISGFALSWLAGVITPGSPAGLGIRESILAGLLATTYSDGDALVLVLGIRVATTIGDLLSFGVGYYATKLQ